MPLRLSYGEASAAGPRPENQDAIRIVTPAPGLATGKGYLFALADGVSQCADGALAARATLQALAFDYYATPETWAVAQSLDRLFLGRCRGRGDHALGGCGSEIVGVDGHARSSIFMGSATA